MNNCYSFFVLFSSITLAQNPSLQITLIDSTIELSWNEPAVLQSTSDLNSDWVEEIGPMGATSIAVSGHSEFYRCYVPPFPIVDTQQTGIYSATGNITAPAEGAPFSGQDAQHEGHAPQYTTSGDGKTVYEAKSGMTWTQSCDWDEDGTIDYADKLTFEEAVAYPSTLNAVNYGGYNDWRFPTIKELYSLFLCTGIDPSGYSGTDPSGLTPFIDTDYFDFGYGDTDAGERIIDAQFWSRTEYVDTTMAGDETVFGVNFADGRIKGYPKVAPGPSATAKKAYVYFVRGNIDYGVNNFVDNGDGTVTDLASGLMWQQTDSGTGKNWEDALAYAEDLTLAGYDDWRLPNVKELQSILDYTRSPATHGTAAIDPVFTSTPITDEGGGTDYPFYWSSSTHVNYTGSVAWAMYVCFGTAYGYMEQPPGSGNYNLLDVHGAGTQRSDPKSGSSASYPNGHGPQGDVVRITNFVRAVRGAASAQY